MTTLTPGTISEERAGEHGVTIGAGGVVIAIDGVPYKLSEPKVRDLRELDKLFWEIGQGEETAIPAGPDPSTSEDDQQRASTAQMKAAHAWRRESGGYSPWYALALKLLAAHNVPADELPAWTVDGTQALVLISWWWKTPLALGVTPAK